MSLRARLVVALSAIALAVSIPALYGALRLESLRGVAVELRERHAAATAAVGRANAGLADARQMLRSHAATGSGRGGARADSALARVAEEMRTLGELGYGREARAAATLVGALRDRASEVRERVRAGELEEATTSFGEFSALVGPANRALVTVEEAATRESSAAVARAQEVSTTATRNAFLGLAIALLLAGLIGVRITGSLVGPLRRLREATATVADGELATPEDLPYDRKDEIGDLARSFRTMTERLGELNALKAEFMSAMTHRLKTPVAVIQGYAAMLADGEFGELTSAQRETLSEIGDQTYDVVARIDRLLDIARVEAGSLQVEPELVRLEDLLHELRTGFAPLARQRRIELDVEVASGTPAEILVDPDRIRDDVLGNLLSNAFKYSEPGKRVELRAEADGDRFRFRVSDHGPGIPEDELVHVFEPYYRSGNGQAEGSGLGLSIAREVVELHGGAIDATSSRGEGTTFVVTLPLP